MTTVSLGNTEFGSNVFFFLTTAESIKVIGFSYEFSTQQFPFKRRKCYCFFWKHHSATAAFLMNFFEKNPFTSSIKSDILQDKCSFVYLDHSFSTISIYINERVRWNTLAEFRGFSSNPFQLTQHSSTKLRTEEMLFFCFNEQSGCLSFQDQTQTILNFQNKSIIIKLFSQFVVESHVLFLSWVYFSHSWELNFHLKFVSPPWVNANSTIKNYFQTQKTSPG